MLRKIGQPLRKSFSSRLKTLLPEAKLLKTDRTHSGSRTYGFDLGENLLGIVTLLFHHSCEFFTLELGWSDQSRFPECYPGFYPHSVDESERLFLIGHMYPDGKDGKWWELEDITLGQSPLFEFPLAESLARIEPSLDEAFKMLEEDALPFLREIARQKCD